MRLAIISLILALLIVPVSFASADEELAISGVLNPDFASHLGLVSTINEENEEGVFVTNPSGEVVISILRSEIVAASNEALGGFLSVYHETGQSLFELPDGGYQLQITTGNGTINLSYLNQSSDVRAAETLEMKTDLLLQASEDELYQVYLLTTGELSVVMGPDEDGLLYQLSFTGIPALNIRQESYSN